MKSIMIIFAVVLLLLGCKKEKTDSFSPMALYMEGRWGWARADVNNKQWEALACRGYTRGDSVSLGFSEINEVQVLNRFGIALTPLKLGKRLIPKTYVFNGQRAITAGWTSFVRGDNDLICDTYSNLHDKDSLQNWIDITEYNPETKEIKGKFGCNLLRSPSGGNAGARCKPLNPDTMRIRNGTFHTKITTIIK